MNGVQISRKVSLTLTARDWQLYSDMTGVGAAARAINKGVAAVINASTNVHSAFAEAWKVLYKYSEFGAADTEPRGVLADLVEHIYGARL